MSEDLEKMTVSKSKEPLHQSMRTDVVERRHRGSRCSVPAIRHAAVGGFRESATVEVIPRTRITLDLPPEAAQALNDLIGRTRR